jgi:hypothetical protein
MRADVTTFFFPMTSDLLMSSAEFIYMATNAVASGRHDPETEQCRSKAIQGELLALNAQSLAGKMV